MSNQYFISLFEYDKWANKKIAEVLQNNPDIPEKCKLLFSHIGAALDVWYSRVSEEERLFTELFGKMEIEKSLPLIIKSDERWINYLDNPEIDLSNQITYKNLKGYEFNNTLLEILTQLITHGSYHRGQINQLLRQNNIEPALTDYIFMKREQSLGKLA